MKKIFFFDSLLTPKILLVGYWLSLLGAIGFGIYYIFFLKGDITYMTCLFAVGILISIRTSFEMIMIMFKMTEYLRRIVENQPNRESH